MEFDEIIVWLIVVFVAFFIFNSFFFIKTAASIFLSIFTGTIVVSCFYNSYFTEVVVIFTLFVGVLYAVFRGFRDRRRDMEETK